MHSSLRCLFRLRLHAPSLRRHLLGHASAPPCHARTLRVPMMCRSSPPRVSFTSSSSSSTGINGHLASFDSLSGDDDDEEEEEEEEEEEGSKRRGRSVVSSYYDPVQDRVVTVSQRVEDSVGSVGQVGTSDRGFEEEEEREKKSGQTIWERSRKLRGKEEKTVSSRISSGFIKRKGKNSKDKVAYQCDSCGSELSQWWGVCPRCGGGPVSQCVHEVLEVNPKRGAEVSEAVVRTWLRQKPGSMVPKTLADINTGRDQAEWRIQL